MKGFVVVIEVESTIPVANAHSVVCEISPGRRTIYNSLTNALRVVFLLSASTCFLQSSDKITKPQEAKHLVFSKKSTK